MTEPLIQRIRRIVNKNSLTDSEKLEDIRILMESVSQQPKSNEEVDPLAGTPDGLVG